jgi:ribosomal protein S18 acetylase RimI-like enzyme
VRGVRVVEVDGERLRTGAWRAEDGEAYVAPLAGGPVPSPHTIRRCLEQLAARGYRAVLTSALGPEEQAPFLECGFDVHERLHLLAHDLEGLPPVLRDPRLRRGLRFDRVGALRIDEQAFPPFWQLDRRGLREALTATPVARFRVAGATELHAYAVTGRSLDRGYLQRLAVGPAHQRQGLGTSLVLDALWWSRRRGARALFVNTQEANHRAVALYERLGFRRQDEGLAVLHRALAGAPS